MCGHELYYTWLSTRYLAKYETPKHWCSWVNLICNRFVREFNTYPKLDFTLQPRILDSENWSKY